MKFIIQSDGEIPMFDWQIELLNNLKYQNQVRDKDTYLKYVMESSPDYYFGLSKENLMECIPVGSVEFVHEFFEGNDIPIPDPVNIPESLFHLSGLDPIIHSFEEDLDEKRYIKSCDTIKHPFNGLSDHIPFGVWQSTKNIEEGFDVEFRCFVFNGSLLDIKPYAGKWFIYNEPIYGHVKDCINKYKDSPPIYTLDVGSYKGKYYIIEVHNFYSCGLYGFSMPHLYPQMLSQWYLWWLRKNGI